MHPANLDSNFQKIAIVLMALTPEAAAKLFKELGVEQSQAVTSQLKELSSAASPQERARVLAEFLDHAATSATSGRTYAAALAAVDQLARTSPGTVAAVMQQLWLSGLPIERERRRASRARVSPGWLFLGLGLAGMAAGLAGIPLALTGKGPRRERRGRSQPVAEERRAEPQPPEPRPLVALPSPTPQPLAQVPPVRLDPICVEMAEAGYAVVTPQIKARYGNFKALLARLRELGLVSPEIPVLKSTDLSEDEYRVKIRGREVARGRLELAGRLALGSSTLLERLDPDRQIDYSHGLPSHWIHPRRARRAEDLGCLVLWPADVLAWHLNRLLNVHGPALLETQEVYNLVSRARQVESTGIKSVIPEIIRMDELKAFLHKLWRTKGSIGEIGHLLKLIGDTEERDPETLTQLALQGSSVYAGPVIATADIPVAAALAVLHRIHHWDINNVMEQLTPDESVELARGFVRVRSLAPDRVKSLWERLQGQRLYWSNQRRFVQWLQQFLREGSRTEPALGPRRRLALLLNLLPIEVAEMVSQSVLNRLAPARSRQVIAEVGKLTAYQLLEKPSDPNHNQIRERVAGEFLASLKQVFLREELQMPGEIALAETQRLAHSSPSSVASFLRHRWLHEKDPVTRFQEVARIYPRRTAQQLLCLNNESAYLTGPERAVTLIHALGPETSREVEKWLCAHGSCLPWALARSGYRHLVAQEFIAGFYSEGGARVEPR
ncbi:hypothetical protein DYH09_16355 [bacterium CPR1]|nr:hypothetical protein [bacterium CPR1]